MPKIVVMLESDSDELFSYHSSYIPKVGQKILLNACNISKFEYKVIDTEMQLLYGCEPHPSPIVEEVWMIWLERIIKPTIKKIRSLIYVENETTN